MIDPATIIAGNSRLHDDWQLRYAEVVSVESGTRATARYYGDVSSTVPVISLIGPLVQGQRVSVIFIPPGGNYVIAGSRGNFASANVVAIGPGGGESASTAAFQVMTGLDFLFTKHFSDTVVCVTLCGTCFTGTVAAGAEFGVFLDNDYAVAQIFFNINNTHLGWSGVLDIPNVPAGLYNAAVVFRRYTGGGSVTWDSNDKVSLRLQESL